MRSTRARSSRLNQVVRGRPLRMAALAIVLLTLLMAVAPGLLAPFPPERADPSAILEPPSSSHWLGTDINGSDVFSRIIWSARTDLTIAVVSTLLSVAIGTAIGAWSGSYAGRRRPMGVASDLLMRGTDALQAFPIFVLALALVAVLGRNIFNVIYVLVFLQVPIFIRLTRSAVMSTREEPFVDACRCAGNTEARLLFRHVLPNSLTPTLTNASAVAGAAILLTAGLSFVGAGVPAPTPEWGYMVATGAENLYTGQWWPAMFPGLYIGLVVVGLAVLGDTVKDYLDPTVGGRRSRPEPPTAGVTATAPIATARDGTEHF